MSRPASNTPRLAVEPGFFAGRGFAELARGMAEGAFSAEDLVRHAGAAIERLNPQLNAFVHTDIPAALAQARALDAERAAGRVRGPLHGIPVAIKDNVDTADMPTTMGAAHFLGHRPAADARCVALLREAGAIVIGKTLTHEFAYGPTGDRSVQGAARNPWDPARITGGSSAGSAAAVAAGMVPVALGTDTGGSVRVPSALCGLVGFKPSHGRVSDAGVFPLSPSIEDVGVLAQSVEDARAFIGILSEGAIADAGDASDAPRIAWLANAPFAIDHEPVTACARAAAERLAGAALRDGGEVALHARALQAALSAIQRSEAYEVHAERVEREPGKYDPEVLERLRASRPVQGWEYVRGLKERARLQTAFARIFEHVDALALPTVAITAPVLQQRSVNGPGSAGVRETLLGLTNPWNVLGLPAISLPAGFVDGLPVGLQLVGPAGADAALLALAARHWKPARA
ncbi:amidase [Achromobacter sp. AONIH1]|uniref:amidase n=1 Tax=Achromobacter sp. AONIH1 TaxID=1758194 RepID=UPI000CD1AAC5|nr:amidase [Achromobacter sp. AONIH1]AUT47602.1 amidase [Achromobacter sp. AONIH1]